MTLHHGSESLPVITPLPEESDNESSPVIAPEPEHTKSVSPSFGHHCIWCNSEQHVSDKTAFAHSEGWSPTMT